MKGAQLTTAAQTVWSQVVRAGDTVVDATCGNGYDSAFLARTIGSTGKLYAFDVQAQAIEKTRARLQQDVPSEDSPQVTLLQQCHSTMQQVVGSNTAKLVAFNLGYLPSSDKSVITAKSSTMSALEAALEVVQPGGLISILSYTGHPGGQEEYEAVQQLLTGLTPNYWVTTELRLLNRVTSPILLMVWRRGDVAGLQ